MSVITAKDLHGKESQLNFIAHAANRPSGLCKAALSRSQYCDPLCRSQCHNVVHNAKLWPFVYHNFLTVTFCHSQFIQKVHNALTLEMWEKC